MVMGGITPLQRFNRCTLQPQLTGLIAGGRIVRRIFFQKGTSSMWIANSRVQDLNSGRRGQIPTTITVTQKVLSKWYIYLYLTSLQHNVRVMNLFWLIWKMTNLDVSSVLLIIVDCVICLSLSVFYNKRHVVDVCNSHIPYWFQY